METTADPSILDTALANLPHGRSFRFLDSLSSLTPGTSGRASYKIRGDEPFLEAHFPGNPMMPGVLLIEAIAQLGGIVCQCDPAIPELTDLRLTAIRNAKILGAAQPGQTLTIESVVEGRMEGLVQVAGTVHSEHDGRSMPLAKAKVTLSGELPT